VKNFGNNKLTGAFDVPELIRTKLAGTLCHGAKSLHPQIKYHPIILML